jgi:hypothetical protein
VSSLMMLWSWNTTPMSVLRRAAHSSLVSAAISLSWYQMAPVVGFSKPAMTDSSVVLPEPLLPKMVLSFPDGNSTDSGRSA